MLAAFLATLPVYAPNHLLFETGVFDTAVFMAPFANTLLVGSAVAGTLAATAAAAGRAPFLGRGWVLAGACCYLLGYGLFLAAAAVPGAGTSAAGVFTGTLLALGTVELAIAWGTYLAAYDLRQALLWMAVMVGLSSLLAMLLASVTFVVGALVFCALLPLGCFLPCWKAARGELACPHDGAPTVRRDAAVRGGSLAALGRGVAAMGRLLAMPFAGLMVFAFLMGARKFILFDVVHMEVLGCVLGALVVVPLCFVRSSRALLPVIYRLVLPAFALLLIADALGALWRASRTGAVSADGTDDLPGRPAAAAPRTLDVAARCEALADGASLTPREREILGYLGRGHGIAFVAETLVISDSTVRTHVKAIYRKLAVGSREELLAKVDEG